MREKTSSSEGVANRFLSSKISLASFKGDFPLSSSTLNRGHKLENLRVKKLFPLVWRPNISGDEGENWKEKLNKGERDESLDVP